MNRVTVNGISLNEIVSPFTDFAYPKVNIVGSYLIFKLSYQYL